MAGLPRSRKEVPAKLGEWREVRPLSPCADQTPAQIHAYYRDAPAGAPAAVRHTQGGMLGYAICKVEGRNARSGRVFIENAGALYMKSGRNCFHPTGQTTLVEPTETVLMWAKEHPRGEFGVASRCDQAGP